MYTIQPGWIDTAGRCRTWNLFAPDGAKIAEVTCKRDAEALAAVLNAQGA